MCYQSTHIREVPSYWGIGLGTAWWFEDIPWSSAQEATNILIYRFILLQCEIKHFPVFKNTW